jgi:hypothetical protein
MRVTSLPLDQSGLLHAFHGCLEVTKRHGAACECVLVRRVAYPPCMVNGEQATEKRGDSTQQGITGAGAALVLSIFVRLDQNAHSSVEGLGFRGDRLSCERYRLGSAKRRPQGLVLIRVIQHGSGCGVV